MRHLTMLSLYLTRILEHRLRSFIWFLNSLLNPAIMILFWQGSRGNTLSAAWSLSYITSYYFLNIIASAMLMAHIEDDVAKEDIKDGMLVSYLVRPYSYYWLKFYEEIPYRLLQGFYGILVFIGFTVWFGGLVKLATDPLVVILSCIIIVLGYFMSFGYKMLLGLTAFWLIEMRTLFELSEIIILLLGGITLPLEFFPIWLKSIAYALPFAYMIYFPIVAVLGRLSGIELIPIIGIQIVWVTIFYLLYKLLWSRGVRKFSGIGQ